MSLYRTLKRVIGNNALILSVLGAGVSLPSASAYAADTFNFGQGQWLSIGAGLRADTTTASAFSAEGNGLDTSQQFGLDNARLYLSGGVNQYIKGTFDTDKAPDGPLEVLDAYIQFEPMDTFNVWIGQMLPPSDRANLDGPFYLSSWLFPGIVSQYPARFMGRDIGGTIWGKALNEKLVYSVGSYLGHNRITGASNEFDHPLFAARVAYNFWDAEPDPAYYESSTYYGKYNILTIALAGQFQQDGVGTAVTHGDYASWNADALFEKNFPGVGVFTLEGAYYQYNTGGVTDVPTTFNGAGLTANVGGLTQGHAYLASGDYMLPFNVGPGGVQPYVRYQRFDASLTGVTSQQYDFGVNYVLKGHDALISLDYARDTISDQPNSYMLVLGFQVQL